MSCDYTYKYKSFGQKSAKPVSHAFPLKPAAQAHVNPVDLLLQTPPF